MITQNIMGNKFKRMSRKIKWILPVLLGLALPTTGWPADWENVSPPGAIPLSADHKEINYGYHFTLVDPKNPGTVYVGTCRKGLWKSKDSGATWTNVGEGKFKGHNWWLAVDPHSSNIYCLDGYGSMGLWRSPTGDGDWTDILPQPPLVPNRDVYSIAIDPYHAGHIILTFHSTAGFDDPKKGGYIESFDNGANWKIVQGGFEKGKGDGKSDYLFFLNNSQSMLDLTNDGKGLWKTSDGGTTWRKVLENVTIAHGETQLFRSPKSGNYYLASYLGIFRSSDNGETWVKLLGQIQGPNLPGRSWGPSYGYMAVSGDGERVFAATATLNEPSTSTTPTIGGVARPVLFAYEAKETDWQPLGTQTFRNGPSQLSYDSRTGYLFGSMWQDGEWRLKLN